MTSQDIQLNRAQLADGDDSQELSQAFTLAVFLGEPGHSGGALDVEAHGEAMGIVHVPEPQSLLLAAFALIVATIMRRHVLRAS